MFNHYVGHPGENCLAVNTASRWNSWHIATVRWTAHAVTFRLDGRVLGISPVSPTHPMHLILQAATTGDRPAPAAGGHLLIDWVTIDAPN